MRRVDTIASQGHRLLGRAITAGVKLLTLALIVGMPRWDNIKKAFATGDAFVSSDFGVPATITANGNSGWLSASQLRQLNLTLVVGGATGTAPTLDMLVETSDDAAGATNVRTIAAFTQKTGAATERKTFAGFDDYYRVRWTIGGSASPTFTGVTLTGSGK